MADASALGQGVVGGDAVSGRLRQLVLDGWHVLDVVHGVPLAAGFAPFDHLLIGPGGVYTLATRIPPAGRVSIGERSVCAGGHVTPFLRNARREATCVSALFSRASERFVAVRAALVVSGGSLQRGAGVRRRPGAVLVLGLADVPRAFTRLRWQLRQSEVAELAELARTPGTWLDPPEDAAPRADVEPVVGWRPARRNRGGMLAGGPRSAVLSRA